MRSPSADAGDAPEVLVEGRPLPWREGRDLAAVVRQRGLDPAAVATAVNGRFVPRAQRASTQLAPGDAVSLIVPIVGG